MAGCPFGEHFPGWRMLVEAFYNPVPGRTYGSGAFGSDVFGDVNDAGPEWVDVTTPSFTVDITVGADASTSPVPVNELVVELRDDAGAWWDFAAPARYNLPYVWTPIRVGLVDPAAVYHPLGYGRVESVADPHTKPPRYVTVTAYGNVSTLVTSRVGWQRPAEPVDARIAALVAAGAAIPYAIDPPARPGLLADLAAATIDVRSELDRSAASAGWMMAEDPDGTIRFRVWPLEAAGERIDATDCVEADNAAALLAGDVDYIADTAAVLNLAQAVSTADAVASTLDPVSRAKYDEHSQAFGFPYTGLAFADVADAQAVTDRAVARWSNIVNHIDAVNVDTLADRRWLAVLADLAIGRPLRMDRRGIRPYVLDTVVTGWSHHLTKDRCQTAIFTSTVTPTL